MIVFVEGLSRSGKTLLIDTLLLEKIFVTSDKTPYLSFTFNLMYDEKNKSDILPLK